MVAGFQSEPKFAINALRGHRGFRIMFTPDEEHGDAASLMAISWPYAWRDGTNTAVCFAADTMRLIDRKKCADELHPENAYKHTPECPTRPPCDFPNMDCACGFYAYLKSDQAWGAYGTPQIVGAVEAWGRCVVGTLGFRAQYAKIVALTRQVEWPHFHTPRHPDLVEMLPERFRLDTQAKELEARWIADAVARRFPHLPMYDTREAMLANFPTIGTASDKPEVIG